MPEPLELAKFISERLDANRRHPQVLSLANTVASLDQPEKSLILLDLLTSQLKDEVGQDLTTKWPLLYLLTGNEGVPAEITKLFSPEAGEADFNLVATAIATSAAEIFKESKE